MLTWLNLGVWLSRRLKLYKSFPLRSCKSYLRNCKFSYPENEVDLVLPRAGIFETLKDIDDFTMLTSALKYL